MSSEIKYSKQQASLREMLIHLNACDRNHSPELSDRVNISEYAEKIFAKAVTFEAWKSNQLVGLIAVYLNRAPNAYITNVSVISECMRMGIANELIAKCITHTRKNKFKAITLEVVRDNTAAIQLYKKYGFNTVEIKNSSILMKLDIGE